MKRLTIALGSTRAAKIEALRSAMARIATVDRRFEEANILSLAVEIAVPAMPLNADDLMLGSRLRAEAVQAAMQGQGTTADYFVGLEGGFQTIGQKGEPNTFLCNWAFVMDGQRGNFGIGPAILVPPLIVEAVVAGQRELGLVIDEVAGEQDVRSRQGAWGVLSLDLLTRAMSFEAALLAAFAPFYNPKLYA